MSPVQTAENGKMQHHFLLLIARRWGMSMKIEAEILNASKNGISLECCERLKEGNFCPQNSPPLPCSELI
jgi:hypothetical protein